MRSGYVRTKLLIGAAIAGFATVTLLYVSVLAPWKRPQKVVPVVVAAQDISADTVISPGMLRFTTARESQLQPGAATRATEIVHKVTTVPLRMGEQFVTTALVDKATAFGLAGIIPLGTRAMTITVDAADAVSGFIKPGDHIDVLATFTQGSDAVARTILQDVILLAVNANLQLAAQAPGQEPGKAPAAAPQGQPEPTTTKVTIAVTPQEAERLVAAQFKGKLKIGLRGMNDASRFATGGASVNAMFGVTEPPSGVSVSPVGAPARQTAPRKTVSAKRRPKQTALLPQPTGYGTLPPFIPKLQAEPKKIRVIKGGQVQEVEVDH